MAADGDDVHQFAGDVGVAEQFAVLAERRNQVRHFDIEVPGGPLLHGGGAAGWTAKASSNKRTGTSGAWRAEPRKLLAK